jgi:predicted MFS family arabinose efflux permease
VTASHRLAEPLRLFAGVARNADLRRLELAWAASNLASRASAIAVAVYAYEADGVAAVGVVAFVRLAVAAAASSWLAVLADRRPRRQVMIGCDLARCLMLGAMAALAPLEGARPAVYTLSVLIAVPEPLFRSAQVAHTPALVRTPEELTAANVLASGVESVGLFAGPAFGALLLAVSSSATVFAATAGLALVSVALVARIGVAGEPAPEPSAARWHTLLAGWRAIVAEPGLRVVIALFSAQTLVAGMLNVLVVVLAIELLELGTAGVGWLDGMVGVGATVGVLLVAGFAGRRRLSGHFAVGLLLWGVPLALIAAWPEVAPALVLLLLVGIGNTLVDVAGITLMQRSTPDAVLGRVFGAFEALVLLAMGLGSLLTPVLVSALGTRGAVLVAGLILPVVLVPLWRPLASIDAAATAPREQVELLRGIPIFAPMAPPRLERLASALVETRVERGATVFAEGDHGDRFFVIADGNALVEIGGAQARTLEAGDFFGEIALLRDVPRTATVRAVSDLRLFALDRETFLATVTGDPASAEAAGSIVAARLPSPVIN